MKAQQHGLTSSQTQREWVLQPVCNSSFQLFPPQTFSSAAACTLFMGCSPFLLQCRDCQAAASFSTYLPAPVWDSPWSVVWISATLWSLLEYLEHLLLLFSNLSVSRIVCFTLSSFLLCSVFYHVLH